MSTITDPIMLDSTGQNIVTALGGIASALTPQNTVNADSIYPVETSPSAHAYNEGDHLIVSGVTYVAIDDIAIGDSLVLNTNIQAETLATRMNHIEQWIYDVDQKPEIKTATFTGTTTGSGALALPSGIAYTDILSIVITSRTNTPVFLRGGDNYALVFEYSNNTLVPLITTQLTAQIHYI